ncbi:response regulator transcription factor [Rhodococcus fascians]|nr:response regulator transcription factor [Rhodococcus fascians]MBY3998227.1 response regulator transcription factor [Rhodococcus fascians]MBY4004387.1 response regulator transcription factor [Rhodococcus fascians]MBY4009040.1 response regulator transcription factor [Rhodococcus fascians]MBY4019594.1 response regulator transcription factor [Rhodococcus fascians]
MRRQADRAKDPSSSTECEFVILGLLAKGLSNREIGVSMVVEVATVEYHLPQTLTKMDVRERLRALVRSLETGILHYRGLSVAGVGRYGSSTNQRR